MKCSLFLVTTALFCGGFLHLTKVRGLFQDTSGRLFFNYEGSILSFMGWCVMEICNCQDDGSSETCGGWKISSVGFRDEAVIVQRDTSFQEEQTDHLKGTSQPEDCIMWYHCVAISAWEFPKGSLLLPQAAAGAARNILDAMFSLCQHQPPQETSSHELFTGMIRKLSSVNRIINGRFKSERIQHGIMINVLFKK